MSGRTGGKGPTRRHETRPEQDGGAVGTGRSRRPQPRREVRGGAEAVRAERRAARESIPERSVSDTASAGAAIIRSAWAGTAVFVVASAVAVVVPSARVAVVVVDLLLLLAGSGLYFWGWAVAAGRSREAEISLWNLILLEDVAPRGVRARLLGALAVQVVVAAATCWITAALAFGWLVPVWGLAHCEYWGARHGVFVPRTTDGIARRRRR